jgi:hypothetical protein
LVAAPTILGRELHLDDGIPVIIHDRCPADTGLADRTGGLFPLPVNLEVLGVKAGPFAGFQ